MTAWTVFAVGLDPWEALTQSAMNVTSIITDCGLVSTDYTQWGTFAEVSFFLYFFMGGCTGSTAGSIKIFRWQILFRSTAVQLTRMLQPHRVIKRSYDGKATDADVTEAVANFVIAYFCAFALLTLTLAAMHIDFLTASSAVASALAENSSVGLRVT